VLGARLLDEGPRPVSASIHQDPHPTRSACTICRRPCVTPANTSMMRSRWWWRRATPSWRGQSCPRTTNQFTESPRWVTG